MSYINEYGRVQRLNVCGKFVGISVSDSFQFTWTKFKRDAWKKGISPSERFLEIIDEIEIEIDQIFEGKVSRNIKRILSDYYN